jgi:hypothetical protein
MPKAVRRGEAAVHVRCGGVAQVAGVDVWHGPPVAAELQRRCQPGSGPADHGDVVRPLGVVATGVVAHGADLRAE